MNGKLYLCATPIGNLGDITLRCVETLKMVDLIAAEDTRRTLGLINHLGIEKPLTSYFEHNKKEKGEYLISEMKQGKNIALVSDAGTPAISDPGEDLVRLCAEEGIQVVPIPGAVAGINALISSALPTQRFTFEGFLTVNKRGRGEHLSSLENETRTMLFYEAPHKLLSTLRDMREHFGNRKIALCRELTKIHEEILRTTFDDAIKMYEENPPRGEFVLVIEGKSADDIEKETREGWQDMTIAEHIELYIKEGIDEKEALKKVAKDRGVSKRDIYNEYKR
ncbi:MAG: 16S rRNA (cytidine(1402)-2'-O)-methyltransferase [Clostridia bacterium]|nr:16S rRNA (cytidine(1402)-2'-O)-methyltransferase [Clostridia bacterium]